MTKQRVALICLLAAIFGLAMLLLRENQRAVAAESKLQTIQTDYEAQLSEKITVIEELETRLAELEATLDDVQNRYDTETAEKSSAIESLKADLNENNQQFEAALQNKKNEIAAIDVKAKADSAKFGALLDEKNKEINELTVKKQTLEVESLAQSQKMDELARSLDTLQKENASLLVEATKYRESQKTLD